MSQAANHLRVASKRLWRRIRHYVQAARAKDDMSGVRHIGVDETSVKRGHEYITVVHDLDTKRHAGFRDPAGNGWKMIESARATV